MNELAPLINASRALHAPTESPFRHWLRLAREHQATARLNAELARDPLQSRDRYVEAAEDNFAVARNCLREARRYRQENG